MSNNGDGQPPKLTLVGKNGKPDTMPRKADGKRIDKAKVKDMFFASQHYEWSSFCKDNGWDKSCRAQFPVAKWVEEKRKELIDDASQEIDGKVFEQKVAHHRDVLATLKRFPKLFDKMTALLEVSVNNMIKEANENPQAYKLNLKDFYVQTMTAGMLMRYKHESLHIKGWDPKRAIEDTTPHQEITVSTGEDAPDKWVVEVMGQYADMEQMNKFALSFLDQPYQEPAAPQVITVEPAPEGEPSEPVGSAIRTD